MPLFNRNTPLKIFYSFISFEILRLARNTGDHLTFLMLVNKLLDRMGK